MVASILANVVERYLIDFDVLLQTILKLAFTACSTHDGFRGAIYIYDILRQATFLHHLVYYHIHLTLNSSHKRIIIFAIVEDHSYPAAYSRLDDESSLVFLLVDDQLGLSAMTRFNLDFAVYAPSHFFFCSLLIDIRH